MYLLPFVLSESLNVHLLYCLGKGILIPVLVEIKVEAGSLDVSNQKKESAGKAIESNSSGGSNSKKTSGGEEFEDAWWQELNDF